MEESDPFLNFFAFYLLDFKLQFTKTKNPLKHPVLYDDFTILRFHDFIVLFFQVSLRKNANSVRMQFCDNFF